MLNEVVLGYNNLGNPYADYQEHEGAHTTATPCTCNTTSTTTSSSGVYTKGPRLASFRYPNARLVYTNYGTASEMNDLLNRPYSFNTTSSSGSELSQYTYLGTGTIVKEDYPEPDVRLDYDSGTTGEYAGFDRFGRVVNQLWYDYGASANRDQFTYGYDRASNRLYRENTGASGLDEFYTYDDLNRLATFDRGDLNANKDAITGTAAKEEDWSLDMTGNWTDFVQKTSGSTDLDQDRTQNDVNEITAITASTGTNWADPVHDKNGNMTTIPKPSSLANGLTATYDAWNRLVEVADGETTIATYEYDGLNRRIKKGFDSDAPSNPDGIDTYVHYYYNRAWQVVETRETDTESAEPENLQPKYQYIWSFRYIDAAILRDENTDQDSLCDDARIYYLNDANFNVTTLVDTSGDALERYVYSPYGLAAIYDGTWSNTRSTSSYDNTVLYTGREYDPETGLYQYRNRYYSAELGTFVSRDPILYQGGINVYEYVFDSPTDRTDPSGFQSLDMSWCFGPTGSFFPNVGCCCGPGYCCDYGPPPPHHVLPIAPPLWIAAWNTSLHDQAPEVRNTPRPSRPTNSSLPDPQRRVPPDAYQWHDPGRHGRLARSAVWKTKPHPWRGGRSGPQQPRPQWQNGQHCGSVKGSHGVQKPPVGTTVRSTCQTWLGYLAVTTRSLPLASGTAAGGFWQGSSLRIRCTVVTPK